MSELQLSPAMSDELRLLCLLAREPFDRAKLDIATNLATRAIDWDGFCKAIAYHGLVLSVYPRLEKDFKHILPVEIDQRLSSLYQFHIRLNYALLGKLFSAYRTIAAAGVQVIAFKGPVTAEKFYGHYCNRQYGDIDLLVAPQDFERAYGAITSLGLRPFRFGRLLEESLIKSRVFQSLSYEVSLIEPGAQLEIDLHWRVRPHHDFPMDFAELSTYCETITIEGQAIQTLSAEALLVIHCITSSSWSWQRLNLITDTARIAATAGLNWDSVAALASRLRCTRMVQLGLALAASVYACAVPHQFAKIDQDLVFLRDLALQNLENFRGDPALYGLHWRFDFKLRPGIKAKIGYLWQYMIQPDTESWEKLLLPDGLIALYYPLRFYWQVEGLLLRGIRRLTGRI